MEISAVNIQIKTQDVKDTQVKDTNQKTKDKQFTQVYDEVSSRSNDTDSKDNNKTVCKIADQEKSDINTSDEKEDASKLNKDITPKGADSSNLSRLVEMLLMSGNLDPKFINQLQTQGAIDPNEIKAMLEQLIKGNLTEGGISGNSEFSGAKGDKQILPIKLGDLMAAGNGNKLDSNIEKLADELTKRLSKDTNLINTLAAKVSKQSQGTDDKDLDSLKGAIMDQLKGMLKDNAEKTPTDYKNFRNFLREGLINKPLKTELTDTPGAENSVSNQGKAQTSDLKMAPSTSNKEDNLLKQLTEKDSTNNNSDKISDKILSVMNRFEVINSGKPAATEGKPMINKATFNEDFIKTVKFMDINNLKELSVKVLPKDLGEIVIRLSLDNGVMKASISAANKDTYNLLNSQLPAISNQLAEQNMTIQNFSLSLSNGENFLFSGQGNSGQNGKQQGNGGSRLDGIEDSDVQNDTYTDDNSSLNILA